MEESRPEEPAERPSNRMPDNSAFFDRVIPILLITLSVVMAGLIIFALGVLLGFIPF